VTARINALSVVLAEDLRDDSEWLQRIEDAISMINGVVSVDRHVSGMEDHIAEQRARSDLGTKVLNAVVDIVRKDR
jgi:hypothetical protein